MNTIVVKTKSLVVVDLQHDLPRNELFPHGATWDREASAFRPSSDPYVRVPGRKVRKVIVHHTGGNHLVRGFRAPMQTAAFAVANPRIAKNLADARYGRGMPGMPYHLFVPYRSDRHQAELLPVVYRCWPFDWKTWHTKGQNTHGVGVACQGSFTLQPGVPGTKGQPSVEQARLLAALWDEWIKPLLGLDDAALYAHADFTKPPCPGGTLYDWVLGRREQRTLRKLEVAE